MGATGISLHRAPGVPAVRGSLGALALTVALAGFSSLLVVAATPLVRVTCALVVAFVLFLVIRAMVKLHAREEAKPKAPETPADVKLLTEIRDLLAKRTP